jgi:hypothetical protein
LRAWHNYTRAAEGEITQNKLNPSSRRPCVRAVAEIEAELIKSSFCYSQKS